MSNAEPPAATTEKKQVLLTCMDPRVDVDMVMRRLGDPTLFPGWDSDPKITYVIRNAGAAATNDALRSIVIVQRLATTGLTPPLIAVVGHEASMGGAPCAMTTRTDDSMNAEIEGDQRIGMTPPFSLEFFKPPASGEPDHGVRRAVSRLRSSRFILGLSDDNPRGFVFDTDNQELRAARIDPRL